MKSKKYLGVIVFGITFIFGACDNANNPQPRNFTVIFNADNGTENIVQNVIEGNMATKPSIPTKQGYNFVYWFNIATDDEWDFSTAVIADIVLKARWNLVTFESVTVTSVEQLGDHLASLGLNTVNNPIPVNVIVNLDIDWDNLLTVINVANKYVALDLSGSTGMTVFDPGTLNTGERFIVELIFPNATISIINGAWDNSTFSYFSALRKITSSNVTSIESFVFRNHISLTEVYFQAVTLIHGWAFQGCINLTRASFPALNSISFSAFNDCPNLKEITFPASTSISGNNVFVRSHNLTNFILTGTGSLSVIGNGSILLNNGTELVAYPSATGSVVMNTITSIWQNAFTGTSITEVYFPVVTTIQDLAFGDCTDLQKANFPAVSNIGVRAFENCVSLNRITLGTISEENFDVSAFQSQNLREIYFGVGGGAGTYIRDLQSATPNNWIREQ